MSSSDSGWAGGSDCGERKAVGKKTETSVFGSDATVSCEQSVKENNVFRNFRHFSAADIFVGIEFFSGS